jgi:hypothetical protein
LTRNFLGRLQARGSRGYFQLMDHVNCVANGVKERKMTVEELDAQTLNRRLRKLEKILFCYRWRQGNAETRATLLTLSKDMLTLLQQ